MANLSWSDLDAECVPLVGELDDLRPHEAVCSQPITIYQQTDRRHADFHRLITTVLIQQTINCNFLA